jgi:hypothetical protein
MTISTRRRTQRWTKNSTRGRLARIAAASTAVFAVVAASLVFAAGAANADDEVDVDNHVGMTICHVVNGEGNTGMGYDKITIDRHAWDAHKAHGDAAWSESSGCPKRPYDVSYNDNWTEVFCFDGKTVNMNFDVTGWGWTEKMAKDDAAAQIATEQAKYAGHVNGECPKPDPCKPTVDPSTNTLRGCMATYPTKWTEAICYRGETKNFSEDITGIGFGSTYEEAQANAKANADWQMGILDKAKEIWIGWKYPRHTDGECTLTPVTRNAGPSEFCTADGTKSYSGEGTATWGTSKEADTLYEADAIVLAQELADADLDNQVPEDAIEGACPAPDKFGAPGTWTITTDICYNGGFETNTVTATKDVTGYDTSSAAYTAAEAAAKADADAQMVTFLAARPGYTIAPADHVCTVPVVESTPVTAVEAATVAAPAPATVSAPAPAKVAAPAAATVPEAVPAGDGSSAPQTPVWMLALLGLGTLGLALGGARIAIQHRI